MFLFLVLQTRFYFFYTDAKDVLVQPYHNIDLMWELEGIVKDKRINSMEEEGEGREHVVNTCIHISTKLAAKLGNTSSENKSGPECCNAIGMSLAGL